MNRRRTWVHGVGLGILLLSGGLSAAEGRFADRWVYVSRNLTRDEHVADIERIAATAQAAGLNGMVLAGGLETVGEWEASRRQRLERVKEIATQHGLPLIPMLWSVGYGSGLRRNPDLAVGLPCRDVPFLAREGVLRYADDLGNRVRNGGFEDFTDGRFSAYRFHDRPGEVSFVDTQAFHSGAASIRFENFGAFEHGHARFLQEVPVTPYRQYRVSCWVRTQDLQPPDAFRIQVYGPHGCIAPVVLSLEPTADWRQVALLFNSKELSEIRLYGGLWGGRSGRIWFDDLEVTPVALVNVLRRPGTPVRVRSADGSVVYEEGRDAGVLADDRRDLRRPRADSPTIAIPPGSRIREGETVLVDYYHGMAINKGQVTVCMSEPELYEYWRQSAAAVQEALAPACWFLSMDEIRGGGACAACKARNLSMGEILADCIRRQVEIIRGVRPDARIVIWSDMLDPNHNAHDHYYLAESTFEESWEGIPRDLVIACWYYRIRDKSLAFFGDLGFPTLAAAYYDGDDMENIQGWIEAIRHAPANRGILYTTWQNKYDLLAPFGQAVQDAARKAGFPRAPRTGP
ncbi:MAG: hypothetical protein JXR77_03595 [Lentisphaeria bacterium]|nr:hypothetical protein [Lentisphaeria bacterium]